MRRLLIALAALALLLPATASAAPLSELAPAQLAGSGSCLHATGASGELLHDAGGLGGQSTPLELLRAGPGGFAPTGTAALGEESFTCAAVAGRPDGAAVLAGIVRDPAGRDEIVAADRSPGGTFAAPAVVARPGGREILEIATALSARGDALVAWIEASDSSAHVFASLRPAGGAFGAPEEVSPHENASETAPGFLGAPADRRPFVAWASRPGGEGPGVPLAQIRTFVRFAQRQP